MIASKPVVYGINVKDSFNLSQKTDYNRQNFTDSYPWNALKKDSLIVIVDTTFISFTSNELARFSSIPPPPPPKNSKMYSKEYELEYKKIKKLIKERTLKHFKTYPLYVYNSSSQYVEVQMPLQGDDLYFIIEALDQSKNWKPIEYWDQPGFLCGTGHEDYVLKPKHFIVSAVKKYNGDYKTKMRIKLKSFDKTYYSNEFSGTMNLNQFDATKVISNFDKKFGNRNDEKHKRRKKMLFLD